MNVKKLTILTAAVALIGLLTAGVGLANDDDKTLEDRVDNGVRALKVRTVLLEKIGWDMLTVDVDVEGSHVRLGGEVENRANVELAKEVALSVDGVTHVDNDLRVEPKERDEDRTEAGEAVGGAVSKAELEVRDAVLESRVKTALLAEIGTNAFDIEVEATDGEVSLRGNVPDKNRHQTALKTTKRVDGVREVVDLLKVSAS